LLQDADEPRKRVGRLLLFALNQTSSESFSINLTQQCDVPAILDAKWCHSQPLCGLVDASGKLQLYQVTDDEKLELTDGISVSDGGLALSLDWSTGVDPQSVVIRFSFC
jgi:hypothetical protein